jgi:SAM-dependent methyltransferase
MLSNGIPTRAEYQQLSTLGHFEDLLRYSREFNDLVGAKGVFSKLYGLKWARDPFLQWSRRWEYVYVLQRLEKWCDQHSGRVDVADAGSGFTFFPFYLQEKLPQVRIQCLDADKTVGRAFAEVRRTISPAPEFQLENLEQLGQESDSFDAIYSVSVIEHTRDPHRVINEIYRTLRPDGIFLCTFDISFEQRSPMHVRHVQSLVEQMTDLFKPEPGWEPVSLEDASTNHDAVTTKWISEIAPETLPWKYPALTWSVDAIRGRLRKSFYRPLTFYCGAFRKR